MKDIILYIGVALVVIGIIAIGIGNTVFRFRSVSNKKAWEGKTKPFLVTGITLFLIGIILVIFTFPR